MNAIALHASETAELGSFKLADYNPRSIEAAELAKLQRSIAEFGFVEPVVARREDRLVIGGHQRLLAYREHATAQGLSKAQIKKLPVPTVWVDGLSDERAKLLNLALNKISGEWDYEKLDFIVRDLVSALPSEDVLLSGFDQEELNDILALMAPIAPADIAGSDVDQQIGVLARRFKFQVGTDAEAELCVQVLKAHGMTGPGNASAAFVSAMRAASRRLGSKAPPKK